MVEAATISQYDKYHHTRHYSNIPVYFLELTLRIVFLVWIMMSFTRDINLGDLWPKR